MAIYTFNALPTWAFTDAEGSYHPFNDGYIPPDGSSWAFAQGTFTYSRADMTAITINDTDAQDTLLNDYTGGENTQQLVDQVSDFPPGTVVESEFQITLTAEVDGEVREYRLVALSANGVVVGYTFAGEWPPEDTPLTSVWQGVEDSDNQTFDPSQSQVCFTRGVQIATPNGQIAIEDLKVGDLVLSRDNGPQPIRWIGSSKLSALRLLANPKLRPIRIRAGALGQGLPVQDLLVSPQHRVLVRSKVAMRMFGAMEVLAAAKQLLQLDGIDIATDMAEVEYFHMLFDQHEIVTSNGAETESLYPGPQALKSVGPAAVQEIYQLFPELRNLDHVPSAARQLLSGREARKLAVRLAQNHRPVVAPQ
ncbi:Hint domain-containing protein [Paracoccus sp. CPCC 101403]|uniref:Hint domain-containing protein n=1 Tax=Paracoccus broussonetiae TaxID=3075834 RepID=A0ABU3EI80_9RHOB|nr:Hint domain-containing protein [Paracoccus sp. CPCC 101403]MDT1063914.1 Hint domain-containing protein [Paracoccus sp. CPCC 101403]